MLSREGLDSRGLVVERPRRLGAGALRELVPKLIGEAVR